MLWKSVDKVLGWNGVEHYTNTCMKSSLLILLYTVLYKTLQGAGKQQRGCEIIYKLCSWIHTWFNHYITMPYICDYWSANAHMKLISYPWSLLLKLSAVIQKTIQETESPFLKSALTFHSQHSITSIAMILCNTWPDRVSWPTLTAKEGNALKRMHKHNIINHQILIRKYVLMMCWDVGWSRDRSK